MPPLTTHQQVMAGADSVAENGNALTWTSEHWPNLAGATLTMTVGHMSYNLYGVLPAKWTGTVPTTPAAPTTVSLDVTASDTAVLAVDEYDYSLSAALLNGTEYALAVGKLTVQGAPGALAPFPPQ